MEHKIVEVEYNIKDTLNGSEVSKKLHCISLEQKNTEISYTIPLFRQNKTVIKKAVFNGLITTKVKDIKKIFEEHVQIFIKTEGRIHMLSNNKMPFLDIFEMRSNALKQSFRFSLVAMCIPQISSSISSFTTLELLRKLIIENIPISEISLLSLKYLKFCKLTNNNLKTITPCARILEYCNLSNNSLEECNVKSKVLLLSKNKVTYYQSQIRCKFIDLSYNPVNYLSCSTKILIIKKTTLKSLLSCDAQIIIADETKNIRIGSCKNLKYISVNNCGLTRISFSLSNLIVFKAANNNLTVIPKLKTCKYVDLSGNFISYLKSSNTVALNLSMNQITYVNYNRYRFLKHLDLTFNPINHYHCSNQCSTPKTKIGNKITERAVLCKKVKREVPHLCNKSNMLLKKYKLETVIGTCSITVFMLFRTYKENDISGLIVECFDKFRMLRSKIDLFYDFSDYLYSEVLLGDTSAEALFVLITNKRVLVRAFKLKALIYNFAEITLVEDPSIIRVFYNSSGWCVLPLVCQPKYIMKDRNYVFSKDSVDLNEICVYLKQYCPRSLKFNILCSMNYSELPKPVNHSQCKLVLSSCKNMCIDIREVIKTSNSILKQCKRLGLGNYDFGLNIRRSDETNSIVDRPIFVFIKFQVISSKVVLVPMEKYNIFRILDFYCNIFGGKTVEKNYNVCILQFRIQYHAAFFALQIERILKIVGIEVSIGISTGLVFDNTINEIAYFGGPGFNKTARITKMGVGVFCSGFFKFHHPLIEMNYEGERCLKGFQEKHRIFSLRLAKKY